MKPAVFLFLSSFLSIVARADRKYRILQASSEPTFDEYYRSMLNYNFEKMRGGGYFFRTGKPLFPNSITIETLKVNGTEDSVSHGSWLNNLTIHGFSNIFVDKFKARVYSGKDHVREPFPIFELNVTIPTLQLQGDYRVNGTWTGLKIKCAGHFKLSYANILAGVHILIKPSKTHTHRADFEKVQIRYVTGEIKEKIGITASACDPGKRVRHRDENLYTSRLDDLMALVKVPLVGKFEELIRIGLDYTLSWDSYYAVLLGKVLH